MVRTLLLLLLFSTGLAAQGIEFFHGSWEEALAKAAAEDKLIFVDAYAEWCGPCKKMSAQVFPMPTVGAFHNTNFINVKYDMEKEESADFRKTHRVSAYPTLLYINAKNEVVHKVVGGKQADQLVAAGAEAMAKMDDIEDLKVAFEAEGRSAKDAFKYIRALVRAQEPHLRAANDYLRKPAGALTEEDNLRTIFVAATDADSRIFDLLTKYRAELVALTGQEAYDQKIEQAVRSTFDKAIEYRDVSLMQAAAEKQALVDAEKAKRLQLEGNFELALRGSDAKVFLKHTKTYLKKGADGDVERLRHVFDVASKSKFIIEDKVIDLVAEAGEAAAEISPNGWRDYYSLAKFLMQQDRPDQALEAARKSMAGLEDKNPNYQRAVQALIDQIEATK